MFKQDKTHRIYLVCIYKHESQAENYSAMGIRAGKNINRACQLR